MVRIEPDYDTGTDRVSIVLSVAEAAALMHQLEEFAGERWEGREEAPPLRRRQMHYLYHGLEEAIAVLEGV